MHQAKTVSNKVSNKFWKPMDIIGADGVLAISNFADLGSASSFLVQRFQPVSNQLRSRYFLALRFFVQSFPLFIAKPNSKSLFPSHSLNKAIVLQCNDSDFTITQFLISQSLPASGKSHANHHKPERNIMNITLLWGNVTRPTTDSCTLTQTRSLSGGIFRPTSFASKGAIA